MVLVCIKHEIDLDKTVSIIFVKCILLCRIVIKSKTNDHHLHHALYLPTIFFHTY